MNRAGIDLNEDNLEKTLLFLNRIRIRLGFENNEKFFNFFQNILEKIVKTERTSIEKLNQLLESIHYQRITFEQANEIVFNFDYLSWQEEIEKKRLSRYRNEEVSDRSAQEILDQIIDQQRNKTNVISEETLKKIIKQAESFREKAKQKKVLEGNEKSEISQEMQEIFNKKSYQDNPEEYVRSHLDEIIPLILYTWSVANKPQFPKDTQIIALLLFIHSHEKGLLEQIRTGEGKTLIVGLTAAFFALCGNAVDIVSSNRDLAIEGEKKCRSFFHLLKLESGHICSEDDEVNHQSYRPELSTSHGNIVYGEVGAFQRDILEQEFNNKKIFGKRYENRQKCLIVDEVDNMCLDRARHVLYLSHEIQSLKWIETLYINIWIAVLRTEIDDPDNLSEHIKDISTFIKRHIENKNIPVPSYMKNFVDYKIERWIDSAFQARFMREDDHFVLDVSKNDEHNNRRQKTIIVLDKDTGVEQYSTRWSHGLAQFLELKYRRKISVESLKAVFISNMTFFQRYKNRLYGLTGTLGSENSQSFLLDLYQVQFVDLPTSKKKSYYQLPSKIATEYSDWLDLITQETIEQAKTRPVLIICENVEATENIWNELMRHHVSPHTIEKYRRDGDNVEERFQKKPATTGDIIIATNKGGRGTDIHVDQKVNKNGGMHVILSYLTDNIRVEEQAFGRTARNGAQGTGQYIFLVDKSTYEEIYELSQLTSKRLKEKLEDLSDVIIEREKINRDNREATRLSQLKQKNILHLQVEEELFEKFNQFKTKIRTEVFESLFNTRADKSKEEFVNILESILKNRWAFWLDQAKDTIDKIENFQQKTALLNEFNLNFFNNLTNLLQKSSFCSLLEEFIDQPEEAIQIGKVCLAEKEFQMAKTCFEKGIQSGDISGFSNIALAFCMINLSQETDIKKVSRRELKKALHSLESIKRNLMSNLKIAEFLPQLATNEIIKKVSSKENFYQDQITGKLEVIGLHLHYLKRAIGNTLEPFDFVLHPKDEQNPTKEDYQKAQKLYDLLVRNEIIQGDTLRKIFRKEREKMEKIIRNDLDPSIADQLILLLKTKNHFEKEDFENIVCYSEELWQILNIKTFENVFILDKHRLEKELPQIFESIWKELETRIDIENVNISIFEETSEKRKLKTFLEENKILSQTKRFKIEDFDFDSLKFEGKYGKIKFNDNGHETKYLKEFLSELKDNLVQQNQSYFYQTYLPYGTQEEEGNKIRIYLKEKTFLKSGGLAKYKYGDNREDIGKCLGEILKNTEFENDKELIQSKIFSLQGDIRSYKEDLKASLKDFLDLKDQENIPSELKFFEGFGLDKFLIIEEDKSWWDWNAFAVAMIGLAQIIGGAILISFGLVNIGGALISEGISDMIYATMAGLSGNFSWKDWSIQKSISFSLSLMTAGIGRLASAGTTIAKIGSVSRTATFFKVARQAASQFATTCLTNFLTQKIIEQIQDGLIQKIVQEIEKNILTRLISSIQNKVEILYTHSRNEDDFENSFKEMKEHIQGALGRDILLPQEFENIRIQLVSSLKNGYNIFADGLKKSNSKYAKIAAHAIKTTIVVNQIWNGIQPILQFKHSYHILKDLIEAAIKTNEKALHNDINQNLVHARAEQLNRIIREYIYTKLTRELDRVLRQIISETLKQIGKSLAQAVKAMIESEFNGKNPIETLKNSHQNKQSQIVIEQPSINENSIKEQQDQAKKRKVLQNKIQNPKEMMDTYSEEMKDKDRALGRADIKMLADQKRRNITVYNTNTGQKEVIRPSGLRMIPAFFKQSAKINYTPRENGNIGHFFTARGTEIFVQINGRRDCLLIAYHESLGRTVDQHLIETERAKHDQYTNQHLQRFVRYRSNLDAGGSDQMIGGEKRGNNQPDKGPETLRFSENINNPLFIEEEPRKKFAEITNKLRKEITEELWPEAIKKLSNENGRVRVPSAQASSDERPIYKTENVRLDDQGPTGRSAVMNLQTQIGGEKYHQRIPNSSTTVAHVLITQPPASIITYYYKADDIRKALEQSLKTGKTVRIVPQQRKNERKQRKTYPWTLKKSNNCFMQNRRSEVQTDQLFQRPACLPQAAEYDSLVVPVMASATLAVPLGSQTSRVVPFVRSIGRFFSFVRPLLRNLRA
jgi:preprotein translocase subunit SecA